MSTEYSDSTLLIDLAAIAKNYQILQQKAGRAEVASVVKANAYGLGIEQVAKALEKAGSKSFFVANLDEGIELRSILPKSSIYIFHGVRKDQEEIFVRNSLIPVLNDLYQIKLWNDYAAKHSKKLAAIIHIDTGMNRLGLQIKDIDKISRNNIELKYVMSHLARSSEDSAMNKQQLEKFIGARRNFVGVPATLANSSGIFLGTDYCCDMARTGIALYGSNPIPKDKNPMQNVVTLKTKILQIRQVDSATTVGYGATKEVDAGSRLATIPVGYADGYLRSLSNKGSAYVEGIEAPIVGRVSMDLIVVDITQAPEQKIKVGTEIELIGRHVPVDLVAKNAGTIGYEILTSLGMRYKREYKNG